MGRQNMKAKNNHLKKRGIEINFLKKKFKWSIGT